MSDQAWVVVGVCAPLTVTLGLTLVHYRNARVRVANLLSLELSDLRKRLHVANERIATATVDELTRWVRKDLPIAATLEAVKDAPLGFRMEMYLVRSGLNRASKGLRGTANHEAVVLGFALALEAVNQAHGDVKRLRRYFYWERWAVRRGDFREVASQIEHAREQKRASG